MKIEDSHATSRISEVMIAVAVAALVAASVLWALITLNPGRPSGLAASMGAGASESLRSSAPADWLRKTPGWSTPAQGVSAGVPYWMGEGRVAPDTTLAQRRLTGHIASRYQVDAGHAARVVDLSHRIADELKLDPLLLLAVISVESSFDMFAQSIRGAQGLMQIRTHLHAERFEPFGGVDAVFEPHANIRVGAELLRVYLLREGSTEAALKAYVGAARRPHDSGYGARVMRARDVLRDAAEGREDLVMRTQPEPGVRTATGASGS